LLKVFRGGGQIAAVPPQKTSPEQARNDSPHQAVPTSGRPAAETDASQAAASGEIKKSPASPTAAVVPPPDIPVAATTPDQSTNDAAKPGEPAPAAAGTPMPPAPGTSVAAAPPPAAAANLPQAIRPPPKPEVKAVVEVGRYTSDGQILGTLDPDDG